MITEVSFIFTFITLFSLYIAKRYLNLFIYGIPLMRIYVYYVRFAMINCITMTVLPQKKSREITLSKAQEIWKIILMTSKFPFVPTHIKLPNFYKPCFMQGFFCYQSNFLQPLFY